jgi:hypothetical protein
LPSLLTWIDQIDLRPFEQEILRELESVSTSSNPLWKAWFESEEYIVETDQYVAERLGPDKIFESEVVRFEINQLWMQRYFLQVLVRKQMHGQISFPETEQKYLVERLWATAHSAAGLIYGLLPEPTDAPLFDSPSPNGDVPTPLSDEDRQWLEDSANDAVF